MGLDFTWLGLEKSDPPSPGDLEKPDPNANPGVTFHQPFWQFSMVRIGDCPFLSVVAEACFRV